ncbi:thiolase family protein [Neobacillus citreus]|uniref:acetyl-CoA C-acetyltransferase n=1 Tax=Neobacillus citreus TaxID=2833578 RepID=A0A942T4Q9_9BACI|nr:thiolase family protein [Neobacillus citreus]
MKEVRIVSAVRTPFGKLGGALKNKSSVDLGAIAVKGAISRVGLNLEQVNEVIMGSAALAGSTSVAARQILFKAGLPGSTPSLTIDRACCSSVTAVGLAMKDILLGEAETVVAGGFESLSQTPYLLREGRWGKRLGDMTLEDPLQIRNPITNTPVALVTGEEALKYGVSREEQDEWAWESHKKYFAAYESGKYEDELLPVQLPTNKGDSIIFQQDESPRRDASLEKLQRLKTVYGSPTITPGNAPGLNDGSAALVLMSNRMQDKLNLESMATILSYATISGDASSSVAMPALAINKALKKAGMDLEQVKRIEINEAFAAMPLVSTKVLSNGDDALLRQLRSITNVNGGAIAIGHPTGASGGRIIMSLIYELRRIGGGIGVAAICGGYGQADAVVIKVNEAIKG